MSEPVERRAAPPSHEPTAWLRGQVMELHRLTQESLAVTCGHDTGSQRPTAMGWRGRVLCCEACTPVDLLDDRAACDRCGTITHAWVGTYSTILIQLALALCANCWILLENPAAPSVEDMPPMTIHERNDT